MDIEYKDMIEDFKTMSSLTQNEGRIRLTVAMKINVRGLLQWVIDEYRQRKMEDESDENLNEENNDYIKMD